MINANIIKNQQMVNIALQRECVQRNAQLTQMRMKTGLNLIRCTLNEKVLRVKANAFNLIKDKLSGRRGVEDLQDEIKLQEDIEPEVIDDKDSFDLPLKKENNLFFQQEVVEDPMPIDQSEASEEVKKAHLTDIQLFDESDGGNKAPTPKIDFHGKGALSLDIIDDDSDDPENVVIYHKGEATEGEESEHLFEGEEDEDELEGEGEEEKINTWEKIVDSNPHPFRNYKKQLLINIDSVENRAPKLTKGTDDSKNELLMKRRLNPPGTLTTSATSHKQHELIFQSNLPTHSADSKKGVDFKSQEHGGSEYYDFPKRQGDDYRDLNFGEEHLDARHDLIEEEDENLDFADGL